MLFRNIFSYVIDDVSFLDNPFFATSEQSLFENPAHSIKDHIDVVDLRKNQNHHCDDHWYDNQCCEENVAFF